MPPYRDGHGGPARFPRRGSPLERPRTKGRRYSPRFSGSRGHSARVSRPPLLGPECGLGRRPPGGDQGTDRKAPHRQRASEIHGAGHAYVRLAAGCCRSRVKAAVRSFHQCHAARRCLSGPVARHGQGQGPGHSPRGRGDGEEGRRARADRGCIPGVRRECHRDDPPTSASLHLLELRQLQLAQRAAGRGAQGPEGGNGPALRLRSRRDDGRLCQLPAGAAGRSRRHGCPDRLLARARKRAFGMAKTGLSRHRRQWR